MLVSLTGGVAHAPGFPLLTMLGRAFAALPIEPAPFRVSLLSALAAAGTTAIVALTARRLGASPSTSVVGALAFATAPVVWRWSVVPEAFPLNDLLVAATVGALVAWQTGGRDRWLLLAALAGGSAIAHHQTAVLLAPAALLALWHERTRLRARPRSLAASAVLLLVGFLPYAYVPLAGDVSAPWRWGDARTLGDVMDLITRRSYGSAQLSNVASLQGGSPLVRVGLLLGSYTPLEALLVLAGAVMAWRERRWFLAEVGVAVLFAGPLFIAYANLDPANAVSRSVLERFFLLPHVLTAPLVALGIAYLARLAPRSVVPPGWVVGAAALAVAIAAALAYASVDRREDHVARSYGLDILQSADQGAVLLTAGDDATLAVAYLQAVDGVRPDVTHVAAPLLRGEWYVRQLRARHPDLRLPGERITALGELVEANPARTFAAVGPLTDNSLARTHWLYPKGLTAVLRRLPAGGAIDDLARENDALLARYHPPALAAVRDRAWERAILGDYAFAAYVVGEQYEAARDIASARTWYRRALSIDPEDAASRRALARIGG